MSAADVVDAALSARAVVVAPPRAAGEDLDVLLVAGELPRVEQALRGAGYIPHGDSWLRFHDLTAERVRLGAAGTRGLDAVQERALFADAVALPGARHLARPAAHHAALAAAHRGRTAQRRPRRGAVIAFSGLDGAGKSTQAAALSEVLGRLGYDVTIQWSRLGFNDRFWDRAVRVKRILNRIAAATAGDRAPAAAPGQAAVAAPDRVTALRGRSRVLTELWAAAIALENVRAQRRAVRRSLGRGRIVICDRHTADSIVSLRYLVGERAPLALPRVLLRALTRRPLRAYLLDVPAETAWARKGEHGLPWLRRHRELYLAEYEALGVRRLDGEAAPAKLAARVAGECLEALRP
ncbi:MAG TPA: hypothetical protein VMY78_01805 [Solirubrobacteraceae bacterium]|nr:hypothetical protein [Solirubrobacteraceae bacterium]